MGSFKLFGTELKSLKERKGLLIALVGVMLIPIVYVAVLLSATWGPYDNLENLPVAFINKDAGGVSSGQPINVGEDLVATLKESKTLGWNFVSEEEAYKGLESHKYYMVIEIPEDFSQKVTTVLDPNPQVPELRYIQNEGLNFMAAQVTNSAVERLREQLGDKITATYARTVFSQFTNIETGFTSGADGSNQIYDGTTQLAEGTGTLLSSLTEKSGDINKLAEGAKTADTGAGKLLSAVQGGTAGINALAIGSAQVAAGANSIQDGANKLLAGSQSAAAGTTTLATGIEQKILPGAQQIAGGLAQIASQSTALSSGAQQIADGATAVVDALEEQLAPGAARISVGLDAAVAGIGQLAPGSAQVAAGIEQLAILAPQLAQVPQFQQLLTGAKTVAEGLEGLNNQAPQIQVGAQAVADGLKQLSSQAAPLKPGAQALNKGVQQVAGGVAQLAPGAAQLAQGLEQEVLPGAQALNAGIGQLYAGQKNLAAGAGTLQTGASQVAAGNKSLTGSWATLNNGVASLKDGLTQISAGNETVATGWVTMTEGVTALNDGSLKLQAGSKELATGLEGGAEQVGAIKVTDENIAMFASPVVLAGEKVNGYTYYRDSTAPYILSLALFVGMLVLTFFLDFKKPAVFPVSALSWFASKWLQLALFATIQAVLMSLFTLIVLQLDVSNVFAYILFSIFVSITFMSIVFFLVSAFNNVGRFIGLAFIIVQLSITGSNLPIPMLPENLRALSQVLPLTYSNAGFKSVISLGDTGLLASNATVLAFYLIASSAFALVAFMVGYKALTAKYKPDVDATV